MNHTIAVILSANATSFATQMAIASGAVDRFDSKSAAAGGSSGGLNKFKIAAGAAAIAVAVILATAVASGVKQFIAFEEQMRNVNSISELSEAQFHKISEAVLDLSRVLPQDATTLARGLYDIASSGFQGAEGLTILTASAKAASAGLSTTATSAKAIVSVINAYGLKAGDATRISDILFQTVKVGILTFDELATQLGDVVGMAAAAGVSIDEVGAAMAGMTLSGISAAESSTSTRSLLRSLIKPGKALSALYKDIGVESGLLSIQQNGLFGHLEKIRKATGGSVETYLRLFTEIRAARGAFALAAAGGQNYKRAVDAIENASVVAGATQRALNEQMKSAAFQIKIFRNNFNAAAIEVGQRLVPALMVTMHWLQEVATRGIGAVLSAGKHLEPFFKGAADTARNFGIILRNLGQDAGPAIRVLAGLTVATLITGLNALGRAIGAVTGFMAHNKTLVTVLAILYASSLVTSISAAAGAMRLLEPAIGLVSTGLWKLAEAGSLLYSMFATNIAASGVLVGSLMSLATIGAPVALVAGLVVLAKGFDAASRQADQMYDSIRKTVKLNDVSSMGSAFNDFSKARADAASVHPNDDAWQAIGTHIKGVTQLLTPWKNTVLDSYYAEQKAAQGMDDMVKSSLNVERNASRLGQTLGLTRGQVIGLANDLKIDLSTSAGKNQFAEWTELIGKAALALPGAGVKAGQIAGALAVVSNEASTGTDNLKAFKLALDAALGIPVNLLNASVAEAKALKELVDNVTGLKFDPVTRQFIVLTEAQQTAVSGLAGYIDATKTSIGALFEDDRPEQAIDKINTLVQTVTEQLSRAGIKGDELATALEAIGLSPEQVKVLIATSGADTAKAELDELITKAHQLDKTNAIVTVDLKDNMTTGVSALQSLLLKVVSDTYEPTVSLDTDPAVTSADDIMRRLGLIDGTNPTPDVAVTGSAITDSDRILHNLLTINGYHARASITVEESKLYKPGQAPKQGPLPGLGSRYGNVVAYAGGGVTPAHIAASTIEKYGEPGTGGEAFVPRNGNPRRSLSVMSTAAGWYGMRLTPDQPSAWASRTASSGGGSTFVVNMGGVTVGPGVSPQRFARESVKELRKEIRKRGGDAGKVLDSV